MAARKSSAAAPTSLDNFKALLRLGRIGFLVYSPIMYTLGVAYAAHEHIDKVLFFFGLACVWGSHLMTHYVNEYFDLEADRANTVYTKWTGGSRVLVDGALSPKVSLLMAIFIALVPGSVCFYVMPSPLARYIGFAVLLLAWAYSAPPVRLSSRGLGETTVVVVLHLLTPLFGYALQRADNDRVGSLLALLVPLSLIGFVRMMMMNMADRLGDAKAKKLTLVVRIGPQATVFVHLLGHLLAYGATCWFYSSGLLATGQAAAILLLAPFSVYINVRLLRGDWKDHLRFYTVPFWSSAMTALSSVGALAATALIYSQHWDVNLALKFFPVLLYLSTFLLNAYFLITTQQYNRI